jgi:hypothetical protein
MNKKRHLQFELPIFVQRDQSENSLWVCGRLPINGNLISCPLCKEGLKKWFDIPDDAIAIQFVVTSKRVPNSFRFVTCKDGNWIFEMGHIPLQYDAALWGYSLALDKYGKDHWFVSCYYWVIE